MKKISRQVKSIDRIPNVDSSVIFNSDFNEYKYAHHPFIIYFNKLFFAMWSTGLKDEDSPGQSIMYSTSKDAENWEEPKILASYKDISSSSVLTAGGFYEHGGTLLAYIGFYEYEGDEQKIPSPHKNTMLYYSVYQDGKWLAPVQTGLKAVPNFPPLRLKDKLILSGNISFPYTYDLSGKTGWTWSTLPSIDVSKDFYDDSYMINNIRCKNDDTFICEASIFETKENFLNALLRSNKHFLYFSQSHDGGNNWSEPEQTDITDCNSKFHTGKLLDGRIYLIHNPLREGIKADRGILSLLLSDDGFVFNREYIITDELIALKYAGSFKGGVYGYPHSIVVEDKLYVVCSINKEDIKIFSFNVNL